MSSFEDSIRDHDRIAAEHLRQSHEAERVGQARAQSNRQLLAEFVSSMRSIEAKPKSIPVIQVKTVSRWVKTGWFKGEMRNVIEREQKGDLKYWYGPMPGHGCAVILTDGLIFMAPTDAYTMSFAPLSVEEKELAQHRQSLDGLLRRWSPEDFGAALAAIFAQARDSRSDGLG